MHAVSAEELHLISANDSDLRNTQNHLQLKQAKAPTFTQRRKITISSITNIDADGDDESANKNASPNTRLSFIRSQNELITSDGDNHSLTQIDLAHTKSPYKQSTAQVTEADENEES